MNQNKESTVVTAENGAHASPTVKAAGEEREEKSVKTSRVLGRMAPGVNQRRPAVATATAAAAIAPKPSPWDDLKEQASLAYVSGLLPRSVDSREKAITIALMGKELGLSPMQSLCGIYVVNGMVALRGATMLRLIYERVPGARITVLTPPENADKECVVEMQRPNGNPHVFRYTLDDARKAGFANKPIWQQHTSTMLRWSAIRTGARVVFADAIAGCYMEDEIPAEHRAESRAAHHNASLSTVADAAEEPRVEASAAVEKASAESAAPLIESPEVASPIPPSDVYYARPRETVASLSPRTARRVTEKQLNRLYAIARGGRWTRDEVLGWMTTNFQKREPSELNWAEYDKLCNHILENPRSQESKH